MNPESQLPLVAPVPNFLTMLSSMLEKAIEKDGWVFSLGENVCTSDDLFATDALLSIWLNRGGVLMKEAMNGEAAPMKYMDDIQSCCGVQAVVPGEGTAPLPIWFCFIHAAVEDWRNQPEFAHLIEEKKPIPVDALMNEWRYLFENRLIDRVSVPAPTVKINKVLSELLGEKTSK